MHRYFIELAYQGGNYHGWQIQDNAVTVQQKIDQALSTVLGAQIGTTGCGRTDAGVHAKQLFAHFDLATEISQSGKILHALNSILPSDIAVKALYAVQAEAHARFDALSRSYEYHIHFEKNPFLQGFSWQLRDVPDVGAMNQAASTMKLYEDFSCFSKSNTQVFTNNCKINHAEWIMKENDSRLVFQISANRFLRNMVRAIVGTLLEIGQGKQPLAHIQRVIESKNRSQAGSSVPAHGLYLTGVNYPYSLKPLL